MNIQQNQIDKLNLELTITMTSEDYAPLKKKKLNDHKRTAEFKGFRKGMVPMSLIEKVYGDQALADAVNDVLSEQLYKFVNESGINTLGEPIPSKNQPEVEWKDGNDFTFVFDLATPEKINFEFGKDDTVPYYTINVTKEAKDEMKKNLKKYYEDKKEEKSEEDMDKEVAERLEFEYKQEADARLTKDIRDYFVEKANIELPNDYLKRWLFQMNRGKVTMEDIEKEFDAFLADFRWQLVRDYIIEKKDIKITAEDVKAAAEGFVAYQYAMYGLANVPEEMIKEAAERILTDSKQVNMLHEQVENSKVFEAIKAEITLKPKKIALSSFKELK